MGPTVLRGHLLMWTGSGRQALGSADPPAIWPARWCQSSLGASVVFVSPTVPPTIPFPSLRGLCGSPAHHRVLR